MRLEPASSWEWSARALMITCAVIAIFLGSAMAHTRCAALRTIVRTRSDHLNGGLCVGRVQRADCTALLSTDDVELPPPSEKVLISHSAFSY